MREDFNMRRLISLAETVVKGPDITDKYAPRGLTGTAYLSNSESLKATGIDVNISMILWNFAGGSASVLLLLLNVRTIWKNMGGVWETRSGVWDTSRVQILLLRTIREHNRIPTTVEIDASLWHKYLLSANSNTNERIVHQLTDRYLDYSETCL